MSMYSIRLSDEEEERIERLAAAHGLEKAGLIRRLLSDAEEREGLSAQKRFIEELLNAFGAGAVLRFTIESDAEFQDWPWVSCSVKCDVQPDTVDFLGLPFTAKSTSLEQLASIRDERDESGRLTISLGDYTSPASVWVATVPLRPSTTFSIKVIDLHPVMAETAAA